MPASPAYPNILFILSDDTDPGRLGCFGGKIPTPHIDSFARRGIRFDRCYCVSSVCQPSRYNFLTGHFGSRCDAPSYLKSNPRDDVASVEFNTVLHAGIPSMGNVLRDAGYRTGFAGKWHCGEPPRALGVPELDADADPNDPAVATQMEQRHRLICEDVCRSAGFDFADGVIWGNNESQPLSPLRVHHPEFSVKGALNFLESCSAEQPFFLHFASTFLHGPRVEETLQAVPTLTPAGDDAALQDVMPARDSLAPRLEKAGLEAIHDNLSFLWLDDQVGAILQKIEAMGELENTLIVFSSDHNNEPGKSTCYEAGLRIPLIACGPGVPEGNRVSNLPIQNIDVLPTLIEWLGLTATTQATIDGVSFAPTLRGESQPARKYLFFENGVTRAVRTEKWKYLAFRYPRRAIEAMERGEWEMALTHYRRLRQPQTHIALNYYPAYFEPDQLYDLEKDPKEQTNLAGNPEFAPVLQELREELTRWTESLPHPFPMEDTAFFESDLFAGLAKKTRDLGTGFISWLEPGRKWD